MLIHLIGDSISIHYSPYLSTYLQQFMHCARRQGEKESLLDLDRPQGANAGDSSNVLTFLQDTARTGGLDADLLLLNCGLHDLRTDPQTKAKQVPLEQYQENLKAIVQIVSGMRPQLIWIRTTPCDEAVHNNPESDFLRFAADCTAYNQAADRIMQDAGVPSLDLYTFTLNLGPDLYCDHVHFHEHFRRQQAAFIAGWIVAFTQTRIA